jgi:hypothetical protein
VNWFENFLAKTPHDCIERVTKSRSEPYKILLKSGIMLQSVVLNDKLIGMRFDKIYVDPTIDDLMVRTVIYPMIYNPRNVIIEDN